MRNYRGQNSATHTPNVCVSVCKYIYIYRDVYGGGLVTKSCPTLLNPWTVACQALLSMGFSSQEYWRGLPSSSPGDLSHPGIEPRSIALQADSLSTEPQGNP